MNVNTTTIPTGAPPRLLRRREVEERVGLSFTTIWRLMQEEKFPRPVHPTPHRSRWVESGINEWINARRTATTPGMVPRARRGRRNARRGR